MLLMVSRPALLAGTVRICTAAGSERGPCSWPSLTWTQDAGLICCGRS